MSSHHSVPPELHRSPDERLYSQAEVVKLIDSMLENIRGDAVRYLSANTEEVLQEVESGHKSGNGMSVHAPCPKPPPPPSIPLTARQREVLYYLAQGLSTKEIAYQMHRSPKTIAAHRGHIMERLELRDLASLVIYAIRHGIIDIANHKPSNTRHT